MGEKKLQKSVFRMDGLLELLAGIFDSFEQEQVELIGVTT